MIDMKTIDMKTKEIINDFFDITAISLQYEWDEKNQEMCRNILKLMLEIRSAKDRFDECWNIIECAKCVQVVSDSSLMEAYHERDFSVYRPFFDMKQQVIARQSIQHLQAFDPDFLLLKLENEVWLGSACACKLLAYLSWLGIGTEKNPALAVKIWKYLAAAGDLFSMRALVFACGELGDADEKNKWKEVLGILSKARDSLSPFVDIKTKAGENQSALELASLILCGVRVTDGQRKTADAMCNVLNLQMLHFILYSESDYPTKLKMVSENRNYFLLHDYESRSYGKQIGF